MRILSHLFTGKGYLLGVWVVNEPDDIQSVWDAQPIFIETDNTGFKNNITVK